jgi:hypothetical protein
VAKFGEALEAADRDFLSWLFKEMRTQRVQSLEFKGLNVVLRSDATPDPTKEETEARKAFLATLTPEPVKHDSMPPELAGPLAAAAIMSGQAPPPWMRNVDGYTVNAQGQKWRGPTDPDSEIDDNELMGANLPVDH